MCYEAHVPSRAICQHDDLHVQLFLFDMTDESGLKDMLVQFLSKAYPLLKFISHTYWHM